MKTKEGRQAERESKTEGEGFIYGRCGNGVSHSSAWEPGRTMVEACRYRKDRGCPAAKLRGGLFLQYREKISLFMNWYAYHSPVILLTACRKQVRLRVNKRTGESGEMDKINQKDMKRICLWNSLTRTASIPCLLSIARLMADVTGRAAEGAVSAVFQTALFLVGLFLAFSLLQAGSDIMVRRQQAKAMNRCRCAFLETVLRNPLHRICRADYGELNENLNDDLTAWAKRYTDGIPAMFSGAVGVAGYMGYLLYRSPVIGGTLFMISLLQLLPPLIVKNYMQVNYDRCRDLEAKITDHFMEAVNGFETIKLYGLKKWWMTKMAGLQKEYLHVGNRAEAAAAAQRIMYRLLDHIPKYGTYAMMGMYVLAGYCSFDIAVEGIVLSGSLFASGRQLFHEISDMAVARKAEMRLESWEVREEAREGKAWNFAGIKAEAVCFGYEGKRVIDAYGYNFDCSRSYLVTGGNGRGKTTLLNLLGGISLPDSGRVLAGKDEFRRIEAADYPRNIFYVTQNDPDYEFDVHTLFAMLGQDTGTAACAVAKRLGLSEENMHEVSIASLSGGERKKVFLAVGFAMNPQWLLLDEPSNNLDLHGKEALLELLGERKGVIMVSHDPMFYAAADYVLDNMGVE